ncbi:MAG: hypothetical protein HW402_678 [Dehalococcoidales bacterium]|nr:hypothetical protein [Dehalococcoidales bacterium]
MKPLTAYRLTLRAIVNLDSVMMPKEIGYELGSF